MIEPNDTANPSRTMPIRSSRLVTCREGLLRDPGQQAGVAGDHAQGDGPGEDADRGHELVGEHRAAEPECGGDQARPAPGRGCSSGGRAPDDDPSAARTAVRRSGRHASCEIERAGVRGPVRAADRAVAAARRSARRRLRPVAVAGGRVQVADRAEVVHAGSPRPSPGRAAGPGCPAGRRCSRRRCWGTAAADGESAASRGPAARRSRGTPRAARPRARAGWPGGRRPPAWGCTARPSAR